MGRLNSTIGRISSDIGASLTSGHGLRQRLRVPLYRNAYYLIMNSAITGAAGLVFWILAARFYLTEEVGFASAAISAMMLLALLATVGLDYGLVRFLPDSGKDANAMINSCLTITGLASVIITLIFAAGLSFWSPALLSLRQDPVSLATFVVFTAVYALYMLLVRTFVAERRAGFTLAQGIIFNLLRLPLIVPFAAVFASLGIFASFGTGATVAIAAGMFLFLPRVRPGYRPLPTMRTKILNQMVRFSFANYVSTLLWFAPGLILPMMVVNMLDAEANAYFYIAWAIAGVLFGIPLGISSSLFAEGSYEKERLGQNTIRSLKLATALVIPVIALVFLVGDKLLLIFDAAYAANATKLLWMLAVSLIPMSLNNIYFGIRRVEMKMRGVIGLTAFIAVATLVLSWALLPRMGISGIGVAWLSSQGTVALAIAVGFILRRTTSR